MIDANLQADRAALISELIQAGAHLKNPSGSEIYCPFHIDNREGRPNGGVYRGADGVWRYKCHKMGCGFCGDIYDVKARSKRVSLKDVLPSDDRQPERKLPPPKDPPRLYATLEAITDDLTRRGQSAGAEIENVYGYTHPDTGAVELAVYRIRQADGKKKFSQAHPVPGGWRNTGLDVNPLFDRKAIRGTEKVIVCEGEKCVLALASLRFVATTSPQGALSAHKADWTPLAGKTVYLWPDNDSAGIGYGEKIVSILQRIDPPVSLYWINPDDLDLPEGGDAADLIERITNRPREEQVRVIQSILASARPLGISLEVSEQIEDEVAGRRVVIPFPFGIMGKQTNALLGGTVTIIAGPPGATKSLMLLDALRYWHKKNIKAVSYQLEENRVFHLRRLWAQEVGDSKLTDPAYSRNHPVLVRDNFTAHKEYLDSIGRMIVTPGKETNVTLKDLANWVIKQAEDGKRLIMIDPITAAETTSRSFDDDKKFFRMIQPALQSCGASLILVTHPRKGMMGPKPKMDDLAGGTAFQRFSQTIFWIEPFDIAQYVPIETMGGNTESLFVNRKVSILKARNGPGSGKRIGFKFNETSLTFDEIGIMAKKKPKKKDDGEDEESGIDF